MDFKPLTLANKELFCSYLSQTYNKLITYDFNSFYMWREWDPYLYCELAGTLIVKSDYLPPGSILFPISGSEQNILQATELIIEDYRSKNQPLRIVEVCQDMLDFYERHWPGRFTATAFPPGDNYIYLQNDLATLKGKRYNAKRNHLNRFCKTYPNYSLVPIEGDVCKGCMEAEQRWYELKELSEDIYYEHKGVMDALENFDQLDCYGAALVINDSVVAFTIGGKLNSDTAAIYVEKADTSITGAYQAINHFFARDYCNWATYINRAEDMGNDGLRQAKMSYHPCHLEKKYFLHLSDAPPEDLDELIRQKSFSVKEVSQ